MIAPTLEPTLQDDEKAAIVLFSLGPERAERFLKRMSRSEHGCFAHALNRLDHVSMAQVASVLAEFRSGIKAQAMPGGVAEARDFLLKVLEAQSVDEILADLEGVVGSGVWQRLSDTPEETLATALEQEKPQTVAVILSRLRPEKAARTLMRMPEDRTRQVLMRLARLGKVDEGVMEELQRSLMQDYAPRLEQSDAGGHSHRMIASIFSEMPPQQVAPLMELLAQEMPQAADAVQRTMFRFDDILTRVAPQALQIIIRNCEKDTLVLALRLATQRNAKVAQYFLENMSKRAADQLQEDMEGLGPVRVKDAERAQIEVVRLIQDLARKGEILLVEAEEDPLLE
jgi:flagellar motor switch protein FliG